MLVEGLQHHGGAGACHAPDPVQRVDGGLECRDVGHADLEDEALAARHPLAVDAVLHAYRIEELLLKKDWD